MYKDLDTVANSADPDDPHSIPNMTPEPADEPPIVPAQEFPGATTTNLLDPHPDNTGAITPTLIVTGDQLPVPDLHQQRPHIPPYYGRHNADDTMTVAYTPNSHEIDDHGTFALTYKLDGGGYECLYISGDRIEDTMLRSVQCVSEREWLVYQ